MKKVLISILTIIFILAMITTVNAATATINVGASSDTVLKGDTFTVTIAANADNNITAMQANLSYDSSKLSLESKAVGTGFSDLSGGNEIAIASTSAENLSKSGTLYTITFKVQEGAQEGETKISFNNVVLALVNEQSVQENTESTSKEVTINIKADDTTAGNQGGQDENPPQDTPTEDKEETPSNNDGGNKPTNNSGNKTNNKTNNKNKNTNKTKLPQTGVEDNISVIAIILLAVIAITSYLSYRKYKNI